LFLWVLECSLNLVSNVRLSDVAPGTILTLDFAYPAGLVSINIV
jgi:hypothetical protein